jgi:gliding motility-associated-like protein
LIEEKFQITVTGGVAPYTIQWSGGNVSTDGKTMVTNSPGLYEVVVTDGKGCVKNETFEVESLDVIPEAEIESAAFEQYNSYLVNFEIQFWNRSFGQITSYFWDFGDGSESFEENPKHTYTSEGEYEVILTVTDIFGCSAEVKKKISVFDYYLVVPNVFTPNEDGINDYFFPKYINIESLEFWILNKWGETIFYTDDLNSQGWNGKINQEIALPGNYVYKLKFKTLDGRTQTQTDLFMLLK